MEIVSIGNINNERAKIPTAKRSIYLKKTLYIPIFTFNKIY